MCCKVGQRATETERRMRQQWMREALRIATWIAAIWAFALAPVRAADDRPLTVGIMTAPAPYYVFSEATGEPIGFALSMWTEVARRAGLEYQLAYFDTLADVEKAVAAKSVDVVPLLVVDPHVKAVFTVDPQGQSHLMRIEAVPGLGDALVSGKVTPSDYLVRKDTLEVLPTDGASPLEFLEDLARLALRIERSEGAPQDIEWAFTDAGIELLQVRPITEGDTAAIRDDGLNTTPHDAATYTPNGIIEMLPGVIPS